MLLHLTFILTALITQNKATNDDMSDEDFMAYVGFHDVVGDRIVESLGSAAEGCVKGATQEAVVGRGVKPIIVGCVKGAVGEAIVDMVFSSDKK
jgi:hypothetical protein